MFKGFKLIGYILTKLRFMYYIVETSEQLAKLKPSTDCFIDLITFNDNFHPAINSISVIYYNNRQKGYIFPVDHSEALNLPIKEIQEFLSNHERVFCVDSKLAGYYLTTDNLQDISQIMINELSKLPDLYCDTKIQRDLYTRLYHKKDLNRVLPISKLYEKSECLYEKVKDYMKEEGTGLIVKRIEKVYRSIERRGLRIDEKILDKYFETKWKPYSIEDGLLYSYYNLHNITGRPTNSFNTINFLALNKDNGCREAFLPVNNAFVEYDFEGYHLKLISKLIRFEFNSSESIHTVLGRMYFNVEELTDDEYKQSKEISFKQIYGGISDEYKNIPFFKKISAFIEQLWETYSLNGWLDLPTGRRLRSMEGMYPQKLFNYYLQNCETISNLFLLESIQDYLKDKKSFITLVVYDSILIDFNFEDGKEVLTTIKDIIYKKGLTSKVKYGSNYNSLRKTNYL